MNEVYWGCYRFDPDDPCVPIVLAAEAVGPEDRVQPAPTVTRFAGNGIARYPALQARLESAGLSYRDGRVSTRRRDCAPRRANAAAR